MWVRELHEGGPETESPHWSRKGLACTHCLWLWFLPLCPVSWGSLFQAMVFINKNVANSSSFTLLFTAKTISKFFSLPGLFIWDVSDSVLPLHQTFAAHDQHSRPLLFCKKTRNILTSLFSAFCFAAVAFFPQHWGALWVWPSGIVCSPIIHLFQSTHTDLMEQSKTSQPGMAFSNQHHCGEGKAKSWLTWSAPDYTTEASLRRTWFTSYCSKQDVTFVTFGHC